MPKGYSGCWQCGQPATHVVQLWLREHLPEKYKCGNRRQRSVDSVSRSLCATHVDDVWMALGDLLGMASSNIEESNPGGTLERARARSVQKRAARS